jgi:hypothetical protein
MVALDRMGKPKKLPPLVLETEEEKRLFEEGRNRREGQTGKAEASSIRLIWGLCSLLHKPFLSVIL